MRLIYLRDDFDCDLYIPEDKLTFITPPYIQHGKSYAYITIGMDTGDGDLCLSFQTYERAETFSEMLMANFEIRTVKLDPPTADIIKLGE